MANVVENTAGMNSRPCLELGKINDLSKELIWFGIARELITTSTRDFFRFCSTNKSFHALLSNKEDLNPLFLKVFPAYREQNIPLEANHLEIVKGFTLFEQSIKSAKYTQHTGIP